MVKKIKTLPATALPVEGKLAGGPAGKKTTRRRGRKKERTQISVRIDKTVMDIAYQKLEGTSMRITDLLERGLLLAVRELGCDIPLFHHARLILRDEGVEFSRFIVDAHIILRFPEVRKLSAAENAWRTSLMEVVAGAKEWPNAREVLNLMGTPRDPGPEAKEA